MVLFQQLCRCRLCDVLFAQKSSPKSLCKCDKLALLLAQLDLWQHPKIVENILPRLCRFCNLMAAKHSYPATACDLLLKLTRPPSFRYWTCIKQEPGTENIDVYPDERSPNANQKRLDCYLPLMVLFNSCAASDCVMSCLLRRALQSHYVNVTNWLFSWLNLTFGILPRMWKTSCQGSADCAIHVS